MPRDLGERLPGGVLEILNGDNLGDREGLTFLLITAAEDGWPHVAMLSVGEVLAPHDRQLRFSLWPGSHTTENLTQSRMGLLMVVHAGAVYYVRARCTRLADDDVRGARRALFIAHVEAVLQDLVDYATVASGIRFHLRHPEQVLSEWAASVEAMRSSGRERY